MSSNSFTNAFPPMQVKSMNGNSPQNAALNNFKSDQAATAKLASLAGGNLRKRRGGQASVVVPQAPATYRDTAIPAINGPNGILAKLILTSNQAAANSVDDKSANVGGARRKKGTKRRTKRRSKRRKKSRKYRK